MWPQSTKWCNFGLDHDEQLRKRLENIFLNTKTDSTRTELELTSLSTLLKWRQRVSWRKSGLGVTRLDCRSRETRSTDQTLSPAGSCCKCLDLISFICKQFICCHLKLHCHMLLKHESTALRWIFEAITLTSSKTQCNAVLTATCVNGMWEFALIWLIRRNKQMLGMTDLISIFLLQGTKRTLWRQYLKLPTWWSRNKTPESPHFR